MPQEEPGQEEPGSDVKKRAYKRVAAAVVLALAAAGGLTMLSRSQKPAPPAQQTVLPAEPAAAIEQPASGVESALPEPVSVVAETTPEQDAPPTTDMPPPPPQVINPPQPVNETSHKTARSVNAKPSQELVVSSKEAVKEALAKANMTPAAKPSETKNAPMQQKILELAKPAETKKPPEPQKVVEPAKPQDKAPPPSPVQTSQTAQKNYAVQLGVFSNPTNATQMQEKLAQHGIKSYTETRLNVGPFQNRAEADQAVVKLRGLGISAVVVPQTK